MADGSSRYGFRQERYFDWAAGVRATDENHMVAKKAFERLRDGKFSMEEGQETARRVREGICKAIFPNKRPKPGNIILGNSATMALLPIFSALGKAGCYNLWMMLEQDAYSPMARVLIDEKVEDRWHDVVETLGMTPREWYLDMLTRQNYGAHEPACMAQTNEELVDAWRASRNPIVSASFVMRHALGPRFSKDWAGRIKKDDETAVLLLDLLNGEGVMSDEMLPLHEMMNGQGGITVFDISHSFGIFPMNQAFMPDVLVGSSSKIAGAEPTIGFAMVSDPILRIIKSHYIGNEGPFRPLAFQFDPEVSPQNEDAMISIPELASFAHALDRMEGETHMERIRRLFDMRARFIDSLVRKSPMALEYLRDSISRIEPIMLGASIVPSMVFLKLTSYRPEDHQKLDFDEFPANIARIVREDGYAFKTLDQRHIIRPKTMPDMARISFHPQVEPDIEGFTDLLARFYAKPPQGSLGK